MSATMRPSALARRVNVMIALVGSVIAMLVQLVMLARLAVGGRAAPQRRGVARR